MKYVGKLFGQIGRTRGYFDLGKTSEDWDALEARAERAEAELKRYTDAVDAQPWATDEPIRVLLDRITSLWSSERQAKVERGDMLCECQAELAAEWARLDWLQAQEVKRGLEITEGRDDPLPFLVLGEDGTTHWGKTYRAAIDAAMKEGVAPAAPKSDQNAPKLNQTGANRPASPRPS